MLIQRLLVHGVRLNVLAEPLLELLERVEETRHDEVQERPELAHRVLDGRARQQQAITRSE